MRNLKNPAAAATRPVKKELIVIDLDSDDALSGEANRSNMQKMSYDTANDDHDDDWDTKIDHQYMKFLNSYRDEGDSYLIDNPLRSIRYEADNGGYENREFTSKKRIRKGRNPMNKKNVESKPNVQAKTDFEFRRKESLVTKKSVVRRNSQHNAKARKKVNSEARIVPGESYSTYLAWLVENSKSSRTNREKEVKVKCVEHKMSLSDSDIMVEDRPFVDEEDSPFVPSKDYKVVDLEEESEDESGQYSSLFRKEIMDVLKQPYSEKEFLELKHEASVRRVLTRCRQTLDGREITYETNEKKPSYLDAYPDFKRKLKESLRDKDQHRALNLLRGFLFYLTKVVRHDAFKPWLDRECLRITF